MIVAINGVPTGNVREMGLNDCVFIEKLWNDSDIPNDQKRMALHDALTQLRIVIHELSLRTGIRGLPRHWITW